MIRYTIRAKLGFKRKYIYKMGNKYLMCTKLKTNWSRNSYYSTNTNNIKLLLVTTYNNPDSEKVQILKDNTLKAGVYMWKHIESGKRYVGSTLNINIRMKNYYNINHLERNKTMKICNALRFHGYSAFNLSIIEYINIENLSKSESKDLILRREQYYLDTLAPEYNILKIAGSRQGSSHLEETIQKMKDAKKGSTHSLEARLKISEGNKGKLLNIPKTKEHKERISEVLGTTIYVYNSENKTLLYTFTSARKAEEFLECSRPTILTYAKNGKLYKNKWILSTTLK
jgi:group I intron endonuclease